MGLELLDIAMALLAFLSPSAPKGHSTPTPGGIREMYLRHLLLCGPQEIGPVVVMEETVTYSLCLKNKTAQKSGGPILSPSPAVLLCPLIQA